MTLEELEAKIDEVANTPDEAERRVKAVDLKLDARTYKEERDKTEEEQLARISALESDVASRDEAIDELRKSNTRLADRYGKILIEEDTKEDADAEEEADTIDDLIKKFD